MSLADLLPLTNPSQGSSLASPPHAGQHANANDLLEHLMARVIDVRAYGAVGDGVTDDSAAIQAALDTGMPVFLPAGRYRVPNTSALTVTGMPSVTIVGAGMSQSVIVFDDSAGGTRHDCIAGTGVGDVTLADFAIEGDWGVGSWTERSHLIEITLTGSVHVTGCRFSGSRFMATVFVGARHAYVAGCEYENIRRDGCRLINVASSVVTGNLFTRVVDDSVAIHTGDATAAPNLCSATVTDNRIVDGQGIAVLGPKMVNISGNVLIRSHTRAIQVGVENVGTEGHTPPIAVNISNNVITDMFNGLALGVTTGADAGWIRVTAVVPSADSGSYVGLGDGAGGVLAPWDYLYRVNVDAGVSAGAWGIRVQGNTCMRTLAPTTNYSDYGFGERLGLTGWVDPAITVTEFGQDQIVLANHAWIAQVSGNQLWGALRYAIWLDGTAASAYISWRDILVSGNVIACFGDTGIFAQGIGSIIVDGNMVDGDPLHDHSLRLPAGKWSGAMPAHYAFRNDGDVHMAIRGNHVRNCGRFLGGSNIHAYEGNLLHCDPTQDGDDADNAGIRYLSTPATFGVIVVEDCDPASATYGLVLNQCQTVQGAMPTTGKYVRGHFVRNSQPTSGSEPFGWMRITTGSAHALNTDWVAVAV